MKKLMFRIVVGLGMLWVALYAYTIYHISSEDSSPQTKDIPFRSRDL